MTQLRATAIVLAAGAGRRLGGDLPKAFLTLADRPILTLAAAAAAASPAIEGLIAAVPAGYEDVAADCVDGLAIPCTIVVGGRTRQASVRAALDALDGSVEVVVVHDAARPFAPPDLFTAVVGALVGGIDGAIPVVPVTDTVKRVADGRVVATVDRNELALAQTPQAFRLEALRDAHRRADGMGSERTDDAALIETVGTVVTVAGDPMNVKITTMFDLARAAARMGAVGA
jgi:2-C-methyl-D-erythritol 4-phosphate cytidylyltransferase / 2-C-methyl-D-erythritol 2,4-cyclodiphosphate synthase